MKTKKLDKLIYASSIFTIIGFYIVKVNTIMNREYYPESSFDFIMIPVFLILFLLTYLVILYLITQLVVNVEICIYALKRFNISISYREVVINYKHTVFSYLSNKKYLNNMVLRC